MPRLKALVLVSLGLAMTGAFARALPPRFSEQFQATQTEFKAGDFTHALSSFSNVIPKAGRVWNGDLYFGAQSLFTRAGTASATKGATVVARWDGYSWTALDDIQLCSNDANIQEGVFFPQDASPLTGNVASVLAMNVFSGFGSDTSEWLILGGRFSRAGHFGVCTSENQDTVRNIAAWKPGSAGARGSWHVFGGPDLTALGGGPAGPSGDIDPVGVRAMFTATVSNTQRIYIFGDFDKVEQPPGGGSPLTGLNGIAYYDGSSWHAITGGPKVSSGAAYPKRVHVAVPVKLRAWPSKIAVVVGGWFDVLDNGTTTVSCNSSALMLIDPSTGSVTWENFDDGVRLSDDSPGSLLAVAQRTPTEINPYPPIYVGGRIDEVSLPSSPLTLANIARVSQPSVGGRVWERIDGSTGADIVSICKAGVYDRGTQDVWCGSSLSNKFKFNPTYATVSALSFGPSDPHAPSDASKLYIGGRFTFAGVRDTWDGDDFYSLIIDRSNCGPADGTTAAQVSLNVCAFDESLEKMIIADYGLHPNDPLLEFEGFLDAVTGWRVEHDNTLSCVTSLVANADGNVAWGVDRSLYPLGMFAIGAIRSLPEPRASRDDQAENTWCTPAGDARQFRGIDLQGLAYWDCHQVLGQESGLDHVGAAEWKEVNQGLFGSVKSLRTEVYEAYKVNGDPVLRERLVLAADASYSIHAGQALLFDGESLRRNDWPGHVELQEFAVPSPDRLTVPLRPGYVSQLNDAFPLRLISSEANGSRSFTSTFMVSNSLATPDQACIRNGATGGYVNSISMTNVEERLNLSPTYSKSYVPQYWQQWGTSSTRPNSDQYVSAGLYSGAIGDTNGPRRIRAFKRDDSGYVADVYMLEKLEYVDSISVRRARGLLRLQIPDTSTLDNVIGDFFDAGDPSIRLPWESGFDDSVIDATSGGAGAVWDMIPWPDREGIFVIGGRFTYNVTVGEDSWTCVNIALYNPANGVVYPVGSSHLVGDPEENIFGVDGTVKVLSRVRDPFSLAETYKIAAGGEFSTDQSVVTDRLRCIGFVVPRGSGALGPTPQAQVDPVVDCNGSYGVGWSGTAVPSVNAIASFQHELQYANSTPAMWIGGSFDTYFGAGSSYSAENLAAIGYSGFRAPQLGVGSVISNRPTFAYCMSVLTDRHHGSTGEETRLYVGGDFNATLTSLDNFGTSTAVVKRATANLAAIIPGLTCAADHNGDGVVDFFDYLDFTAAFAIPCNADFNRDGVTDFFDYLDFVAAFSAGCDVEPSLKQR